MHGRDLVHGYKADVVMLCPVREVGAGGGGWREILAGGW